MSIFLKSMSYAPGVSGSWKEGRKDDNYAVYDAVAVKEAESLKRIAIRTGPSGTTEGPNLQHGFYEEEHLADVSETRKARAIAPSATRLKSLHRLENWKPNTEATQQMRNHVERG
jgi:hypothetical protein